VNFEVTDTCVGNTTQLIDRSTVLSGNISTYDWRFDDGSSASGPSVSKDFGPDGSYTAAHIITTNKGCIDSLTKTIGIHPSPTIDISVAEPVGCEPFSPDFSNNSDISSGSIVSYVWIWGDGNQDIGANPGHIYPLQGSYQIRVIGTSDKGCVDSMDLSVPITVHTLPSADFTYSPEKPSILESEVTFTDLSTLDVAEWFWDFDDGNTSDEQHPIHEFQDTGTFNVSLLVKTIHGCANETRKSFFLTPDLFIYIPDGFSPNGDQINDFFGVAGVKEGIKNYEVSIYNRWGEKVFYTNNHNVGWDGTYGGIPVPQGSYVYDMRFTDYKGSVWYFKKGDLLLLR
jgi:gliding motility-associated-like protein